MDLKTSNWARLSWNLEPMLFFLVFPSTVYSKFGVVKHDNTWLTVYLQHVEWDDDPASKTAISYFWAQAPEL